LPATTFLHTALPPNQPALAVDVLVIGAGPAGLAAAQSLTAAGARFLVVEAGRPVRHRDRDQHADMTAGHGGAGLYSDGKFSFYPSATELWALPDQDHLRSAYDWTAGILEGAGLDVPPYPEQPSAFSFGAGEWILKDYPSFYLPLDARVRMTEHLIASLSGPVFSETRVERLTRTDEAVLVEVTGGSLGDTVISASQVIVASGRFGSLDTYDLKLDMHFERLEVGFRIEQPSDDAFFKALKQVNPKLRYQSKDQRIEWRTFCACRDGETVNSDTLGLWTVSGRADCPTSGRSNVGFNTRILDEHEALRILPHLLTSMASPASYFDLSVQDVMSSGSPARRKVEAVYGATLWPMMERGLEKLIAHFDSADFSAARLIGPTLEGVGWYPTTEPNLRVPDMPLWFAGDSCGRFRGIVAGLVSGHYVASCAADARGA
jgi:hypothetical protein